MNARRTFLKSAGAAALGARQAGALQARAAESSGAYDVVIYGATPGGIAAALAAADDGSRVLLAEPTGRIGGLTTSGLSNHDFRTFEAITGVFHEFSQRVLAYYSRTYGSGSQQVRECLRGTRAEPKVNLQIFEQMLAERKQVRVERGWQLASVEMQGAAGGRRIARAVFKPGTGAARPVGASFFIDGSYEGDLLAAAGVPFRVGREGRAEYGESLAPEAADNQLQGYNFRFVATKDPANRVTPERPAGYRREDFAGLLPLLADGRIKRVFGYPGECVFKAHVPPLPNGKYDINDVSNGVVRLSLPGENLGWPEGDEAARRRIFDTHLLWNAGLLWFLQNDDAVPAKFRDEAREWGWCKDEFTETRHLPPQLYVREARRMTGLRVFTEADSEYAQGDSRAVLHRDSVAMGDYGENCHGTSHEGSRFGGRHSGEFYKSVPPYQIPYGTLVPREVGNLLAPVAVSASHVGFCALRLEPVWMSMGQAAGHAAHLARSGGGTVQRITVPRLQERLWAARAATMYFSDIGPTHADFAAVQWWGSLGGFHGLTGRPEKPGQRGKNITGQFYEAYPYHAAELDKPLDAATRARWVRLAGEAGVTGGEIPGDAAATRGDWVRQVRRAWSARRPR